LKIQNIAISILSRNRKIILKINENVESSYLWSRFAQERGRGTEECYFIISPTET
jgi:hypothetical protein